MCERKSMESSAEGNPVNNAQMLGFRLSTADHFGQGLAGLRHSLARAQ